MDNTEVLKTINTVIDPLTGQGIVKSGKVSGLVVKGDTISFALTIPAHARNAYEKLLPNIESLVKEKTGVKACFVILTSEKSSPKPMPKLDMIKKTIVVGSGKGGVGKSTISANLAYDLAEQGYKVGLLDADIYGPSLPSLFNIHETPSSDGKVIKPVMAGKIKFMSIGLIVPDYASLVWRGPMIQKALVQMVWGVEWGELDVLIIDLPPGTGDIQITLCQKMQLDGAVIVTTPQDLSLIDAFKSIDMFTKVRVPIIGVIENMSAFECYHCGESTAIFDENGGQKLAREHNLPFLGEVPLSLEIRQGIGGKNSIQSIARKLSENLFEGRAGGMTECAA